MEKHKFDTFILGKEINLVSLSEETVINSNWYNWYNDEETTLNMQQHYFPNTKEMQVEFYKKNIKNNPQKLQLGICHKNDNLLIGVISLSDINYINRTAEFAVIIGEKKYRNFNNFIEASKLIIKHGFESLNLNLKKNLIRRLHIHCLSLYSKMLCYFQFPVKNKVIHI